jgi:hypothetical protein
LRGYNLKRSEALYIIEENLWDDLRPGLREKDVADGILIALENLGMLPPDRDVVIEGHVCIVNKWEPEEV